MSKPSYPRMRRVNSVVLQVLADEVERLKDPRLEFVSITGVDTAPNLRTAVVYFSTVNLENTETTLAGLEAAASRLRRAIGEQVRLKYTPSLEFRLDPGVATGERIDAILRTIRTTDEDERGESGD